MPEEIEIPPAELREAPAEESTLPPENDNSHPVTTLASVQDVPEPCPQTSADSLEIDPVAPAPASEAVEDSDTITPQPSDIQAGVDNVASVAEPTFAGPYPSRIAASRLKPHPKNCEIVREGTPEENGELKESIKTIGVENALTVTDHTCASGAGFVVKGCRRQQTAASLELDVPVVWVSNLSARQEEDLIARDNMLDQLARKLTEYDLARIEDYFWRRETVGAGFRTDLAGDSTSGEIARGRTSVRQVVAAIVGLPESQVRNRHTIYYDEISPPNLKDAVTAKKISRSMGYKLITEARSAFDVAAPLITAATGVEGSQPVEPPEVVHARGDIADKVEKLLGKKPAKKKPEPKAPKILDTATVILADGQQRITLGRRTIVAIPNGEQVELRESIGMAEPVLGGPQEDKRLTLDNSLVAIREALDELPVEYTDGMQLIEIEVTDPRLFHKAKIIFPGHSDLQNGEVMLTWWHKGSDWWIDKPCGDTAEAALKPVPVLHIEGAASRKDELVYFAAAHPYSTIRAVKSFLHQVIFYELGPAYGVTCTGDTWLDRHGIALVLPRRRAGGPWNPITPTRIACPVRVASFQEIEQLPEHDRTPDDLRMFQWFINFDAAREAGHLLRFFDIPNCPPDHPCKYQFGYPFVGGHDIVQALHSLPIADSAILARAAGFEVHAPDFFDSPHPELANSWFLVSYALRRDSGTRIMLVDAGWTDELGCPRGVLTKILEGDGVRQAAAVLHSIHALGRPNEVYPVHTLISKRCLDECSKCKDQCHTETDGDSTALENILQDIATDSYSTEVDDFLAELCEEPALSPPLTLGYGHGQQS